MRLSDDRKEEIEYIAGSILQDVFNSEIKVPIDLVRILQANELKLTMGDFGGNTSIAGAFQRSEKTIAIASNMPYQRSVFTIAHELGHFFLHRDYNYEIFYRRDADLIDIDKLNPIETEANHFAACLLMPREPLNYYWRLINNVDGMANYFRVSKSAMYWRTKNLKLETVK
jgi:Zn-dependent peptidase ImmA (M78 family)